MADELSVWCVCGEQFNGEKRWERLWAHIAEKYAQGEPVHYGHRRSAETTEPEKKK